jgi:hypothetical protein
MKKGNGTEPQSKRTLASEDYRAKILVQDMEKHS